MRRRLATFMMAGLFLAIPLAGCFGPTPDELNEEETSFYPSIFDRHTLDWNTSHTHSYVLEFGPHTPLGVQEATIDIDTSGVWEGGPNSATVHLSYWLPSNTEVGEKVPVVAIVSPYFSYGQPGSESNPTNIIGAGRGEFLFDI